MDNSRNISPDNVMQDRTLIVVIDIAVSHRKTRRVYIISHSVQGNLNIDE